MSEHEIPEAAVEAATTALLKAWGYEAKTDSGTSADIRIALEAAAPQMLREERADLWDEGNLAGKEASHIFERTNPYR